MTRALMPRPELWLLVLISISGTVGMHMFLPALPEAARELGTSAGQMQLTISAYIFGLGLGQLVCGPLSDAWGRRPVLMAGLALYVLGSLLAAAAPDIGVLIAARIVQALGGCAGVAMGRAIARDTTDEAGTVHSLGVLGMFMTFNPVLAPMLGGLVTTALGWRANFVVLALLGASTLALVHVLLRETAQPSGRFQMKGALSDYADLLRSGHYRCFALGSAFMTTSQFAFASTAPFIFTQTLGQSVQMAGVYAGLVLLGMAAGHGLSSLLMRRVGSAKLMRVGLCLALLGAGLFLGLALCHALSVPRLMVAMLTLNLGLGLSYPSTLGKVIQIEPRLVGSATGLYGTLQMTAGTLITVWTVALGVEPALAAACVMLAVLLGVAFNLEWGLKHEARH